MRCMLLGAGLPYDLWMYALQTAITVINRLPTASSPDRESPHEALARYKYTNDHEPYHGPRDCAWFRRDANDDDLLFHGPGSTARPREGAADDEDESCYVYPFPPSRGRAILPTRLTFPADRGAWPGADRV